MALLFALMLVLLGHLNAIYKQFKTKR